MDFIQKNIRRLKFFLALARANSYYTKNVENLVGKNVPLVSFELDSVDYHRYFYVLVTFYLRAGHTVIIQANKKSIARIQRDKYARKLLIQSDVHWVQAFPKQLNPDLHPIHLNPAYFAPTHATEFHVPMCQHPTMYDENIDDLQFETERVNSLAFAGDFRSSLYHKPTLLQHFGHLNRIELLKVIQQQFDSVIILQTNATQDFKEHCVYIADNATVRFDQKAYRKYLASFDFFLALPGIHMPICHNIVEAISLGTIPFVHQAYAKHMHPPLEHMKTAFIYNDFNQINVSITQLLSLDPSAVESMRKNVLDLYQNHFAPQAVINDIKSHPGSQYKLIAEWNSVG